METNNDRKDQKKLIFENQVKTEEFLILFPILFDNLIEFHRAKDIESFLTTLSSIELIRDTLDSKYSLLVSQILEKEIAVDRDKKIEKLILILHEIDQYLSILKEKLRLKIENGTIVKYPLPTTVDMMQFFSQKEREIDELLSIFTNEQENDFSNYLNSIRDKLQLLYSRNSLHLKGLPKIANEQPVLKNIFTKKRN